MNEFNFNFTFDEELNSKNSLKTISFTIHYSMKKKKVNKYLLRQ